MIEGNKSSSKGFIQNDKRDSRLISNNIISLYSIKNDLLGPFLKYFSLSKNIKESTAKFKPVYNNLVLLVNTKKEIFKTSEWDDKIEGIQGSSYVEIINNVIDKIRTRNHGSKTYDNFKLFNFDDNIKKLAEDTLNSLDKIGNREVQDMLNNASKTNEKTNIQGALSLLYNHVSNKESEKKDNFNFMRILIISGSNNYKIDPDTMSSIVDTFNSQMNVVINYSFYEIDNLFEIFIKNEIKANIDFSNSNEFSSQSSTLDFIIKLIENEEKDFKNLSIKIYEYTKKLLSNNDLLEFASSFDKQFKNLSDFYEAINNNIIIIKKNNNKKEAHLDAKRSLEEVISRDLTNKVIESLGYFTISFISDFDKIISTYNTDLNKFNSNLTQLESNIKQKGKIYI